MRGARSTPALFALRRRRWTPKVHQGGRELLSPGLSRGRLLEPALAPPAAECGSSTRCCFQELWTECVIEHKSSDLETFSLIPH